MWGGFLFPAWLVARKGSLLLTDNCAQVPSGLLDSSHVKLVEKVQDLS